MSSYYWKKYKYAKRGSSCDCVPYNTACTSNKKFFIKNDNIYKNNKNEMLTYPGGNEKKWRDCYRNQILGTPISYIAPPVLLK